MTVLAVQIFLLLLAAFLAGAITACLLRRLFFVRTEERPAHDAMASASAGQPYTVAASAAGDDVSRFGRALVGEGAPVGTASEATVQPHETRPPAPPVPSPHDLPSRAGLGRASPDGAAASEATAAASSMSSRSERPAGEGDDLTLIRSIDPNIAERLNSAGVRNFSDIAAWRSGDVARVNQSFGFVGRVEKENWIEQAQILANGGTTDYVRRRMSGSADAAPPSPQFETEDRNLGRERSPADLAMLRSVRSEALRGEALTGATGSDNLKRIRGIGVLIEKKLNAMGVRSYEQVANWTASDVERVSRVLDFKGRIERENWIEQARILASGGQTEFSRRGERGTNGTGY